MDSRKELFEQIVLYIDKNYMDISRKKLLDTFHYHKDFFYELFREQADMTYVQYLQKVRMEKARALLSGSSKSIQEICRESGYRNITWFYKVFRQEYGLTPRQYRAKAK